MHTPRTVVYADDDDLVREVTALGLSEEGWHVVVCTDGSQVLALCERVKPDAILLDLNMPNMDGFDTATAIRASRGCRPARLVAISGHAIEGSETRALASGFDQVLFKPVSIANLTQALHGSGVRSSPRFGESKPQPT